MSKIVDDLHVGLTCNQFIHPKKSTSTISATSEQKDTIEILTFQTFLKTIIRKQEKCKTLQAY